VECIGVARAGGNDGRVGAHGTGSRVRKRQLSVTFAPSASYGGFATIPRQARDPRSTGHSNFFARLSFMRNFAHARARGGKPRRSRPPAPGADAGLPAGRVRGRHRRPAIRPWARGGRRLARGRRRGRRPRHMVGPWPHPPHPGLAQAGRPAARHREPGDHGPALRPRDRADRPRDAPRRQGPPAPQARPRGSHLLAPARRARRAPQFDAGPVLGAGMWSLMKDLYRFMRVRKKYWLAPILVMVLLLGGLLVATKGSVLAPFIYTLF